MYKLKFLKGGNNLCAADLENKKQVEYINLLAVSSLSGIKKFHLPLSGTYKGDYAVLRMINGDVFYVDKEEHNKIKSALEIHVR